MSDSSKAVDERLAKLRLLLFDVDGILTDGGLYMTEGGETLKRFDIKDGAGLKLAELGGLRCGLISGHKSAATEARAKSLGLAYCFTGISDKVPVFEEVVGTAGVSHEETMYMGDDVMDLGCLTRAGVGVTVPEAPVIVRDRVDIVTSAGGGRGAVREIIERILRASGRLDDVLSRFS